MNHSGKVNIDLLGLGLSQSVTRGRDALVLQYSSADRPVAFSTNIHGGDRVVPSGADSCIENTGKYHREVQQQGFRKCFVPGHSSGLDAWHSGLLSCYNWQAGATFVSLYRGRRDFCLLPNAQGSSRQEE